MHICHKHCTDSHPGELVESANLVNTWKADVAIARYESAVYDID